MSAPAICIGEVAFRRHGRLGIAYSAQVPEPGYWQTIASFGNAVDRNHDLKFARLTGSDNLRWSNKVHTISENALTRAWITEPIFYGPYLHRYGHSYRHSG